MSRVIHLVQLDGGTARPFCGQFLESRDWTTLRNVATCQACLGSRPRDAESGPVGAHERACTDSDREPT